MMNCRTYPNIKNLAKLCEFIPQMRDFVKENVMNVNEESQTSEYVGNELETLLSDKNLFIAHALAISFHGVTEEEIIYCIGHCDQKALQT